MEQLTTMSSVMALTQLPLIGCSTLSGSSGSTYSLADLINDIKQHLGQSAGIDSCEVDAEYLSALVKKYQSNVNDWARFFYNDSSKNYTRNAIENINKKANIVSIFPSAQASTYAHMSKLLLVWNPGKGSPVHDHANAHCIMKVLAGQLTETVFHPPENGALQDSPLKEKSSATFGVNAVTYISDDIGLHRVSNPSPNEVAVSLHRKMPILQPLYF